MNVPFMLGVAAGVGVTLFIRSSQSQKIVEKAGENIALGLLKAEDALHSTIEKSENLRIKVIEQTHKA